jgi:hypothetical protein
MRFYCFQEKMAFNNSFIFMPRSPAIQSPLLKGANKIRRHLELHRNQLGRWNNAALSGGTQRANLRRHEVSAVATFQLTFLLSFNKA